MSNVVNPHHEVSSSGSSSKFEKYIVNKAKLFVTWGYKDPALFSGAG